MKCLNLIPSPARQCIPHHIIFFFLSVFLLHFSICVHSSNSLSLNFPQCYVNATRKLMDSLNEQTHSLTYFDWNLILICTFLVIFSSYGVRRSSSKKRFSLQKLIIFCVVHYVYLYCQKDSVHKSTIHHVTRCSLHCTISKKWPSNFDHRSSCHLRWSITHHLTSHHLTSHIPSLHWHNFIATHWLLAHCRTRFPFLLKNS